MSLVSPSLRNFKPIGELCTLINGRAFKPTEWSDSGVPIIRIQNLNNESAPFNYFDGKYDLKHEVNSGDLLFSWSGTPGTSFGAFFWNRPKGVLNQHIFNVHVDDSRVDKRYFRYAINERLIEIIGHAHGGVGLKHITKGKLEAIMVPLPPLAEQKRIADILDKADAIRRKRQEMLDEFSRLRTSAFTAYFGDPTTNPFQLPIGTINDLVSDVTYGTSSKAGLVGKYPILRMNNLTNLGDWDFTDLKYIDLQENEVDRYSVRRGDILFNRTNSKDLVGKTAVFNEDRQMVYAGYLIRVRTNDRATPAYISGYLNSPHGKATLRHMCKSIVGMANINAKELRSVRILIPSMRAMLEYENFVDETRRSERTMVKAVSETEGLFDSLVQRAFKGEL